MAAFFVDRSGVVYTTANDAVRADGRDGGWTGGAVGRSTATPRTRRGGTTGRGSANERRAEWTTCTDCGNSVLQKNLERHRSKRCRARRSSLAQVAMRPDSPSIRRTPVARCPWPVTEEPPSTGRTVKASGRFLRQLYLREATPRKVAPVQEATKTERGPKPQSPPTSKPKKIVRAAGRTLGPSRVCPSSSPVLPASAGHGTYRSDKATREQHAATRAILDGLSKDATTCVLCVYRCSAGETLIGHYRYKHNVWIRRLQSGSATGSRGKLRPSVRNPVVPGSGDTGGVASHRLDQAGRRDKLDASPDGRYFREHGRFGSSPSYDGFGDNDWS